MTLVEMQQLVQLVQLVTDASKSLVIRAKFSMHQNSAHTCSTKIGFKKEVTY